MTNLHDNRLPVLAADIRAERALHVAAVEASIEHAIKCGELLIEAKAMLNKHGEWLPWLHEHCELSERTAQRYMRIARNKNRPMADLGIGAADRMLATVGALEIDLSRGALGVDRINGITILIKPTCGPRGGDYVGWSHVFVTRMDSGGEGRTRRTLEDVHESELVAWLRHQGSVDADAVEWYPGNFEPKHEPSRLVEAISGQRRPRKDGDVS
jgi:Protein of unknown function (DUF3102)